MPQREQLILCGQTASRAATASVLKLDLHGRNPNVRLHMADISERMLAAIPEPIADLMEIAAYVYAADAGITRGGRTDPRMGSDWRRHLRFDIAVRQPELWSSAEILAELRETLGFLSDDNYAFEFRKLDEPPPMTSYLELGSKDGSGLRPDAVVMFSGGLDSLAGALEQLAASGTKVALVSHRSAPVIAKVQTDLVARLRQRFGSNRVLHVPVRAGLTEGTPDREYTHRTRSFLFAALGAAVASMFGREQVYLFENGIVSLNFPTLAAVVGARATRTTHPRALAGFGRLLSAVTGKVFTTENPFVWSTKAEVVERLVSNGGGGLVRHTRSCTRVREMTRMHSHCGSCSQCIDRRFGILRAGAADHDPQEAYKVELFTGEREQGPNREVAMAFVRTATEIDQMDDVAFFSHFPEAGRVIDCFPEPADTVARRILDLYRRHALGVCEVFDGFVRSHASALREGRLPGTCLVSLVVGRQDGRPAYPAPSRPFERIEPPQGPIRMAIDRQRAHVSFDGWGLIKGADAKLLLALAEPFLTALGEGSAPKDYPFTSTRNLCELLRVESDEVLRRRVNRCRKAFVRLAVATGVAAPEMDAVIETLQWYGYRLNPDRVRLLGS